MALNGKEIWDKHLLRLLVSVERLGRLPLRLVLASYRAFTAGLVLVSLLLCLNSRIIQLTSTIKTWVMSHLKKD